MKNVNLAFRKAIYDALQGNTDYTGLQINVFEEYLMETQLKKKTALPVGCDAFIILLNQTQNDLSPKCMRNDEVSIQIQINTIWPAGKGGSFVAEEISEKIMSLLFTSDGLLGNIQISAPFDLWKLELLTIRNINYDFNDSRAWVTQLIISGQASQ